MDRNEEITEKLIQYLDGELSGEEQIAIETLLSKDETLQRELDNLELAQNAVRSYGLKNQVASVRREMLESMGSTEAPSGSRAYPFLLRTMRYAAVILFALISVTVYLYATTSASRLYYDNYQPYKVSVTRGESSPGTIVSSFNDGNYGDVIATFKKTANPTNRDYFLVAQAYQLTHHYNNAINSYKQVIALRKGDNTFRDDAEYYLALTYLEKSEPANAKPIFEKIYSEPDHLYNDKISFWMILKLKMLVIKDPGK